jgi:hypothetical protein
VFLLSPLAWFYGTVGLTYCVEAFFSALIGFSLLKCLFQEKCLDTSNRSSSRNCGRRQTIIAFDARAVVPARAVSRLDSREASGYLQSHDRAEHLVHSDADSERWKQSLFCRAWLAAADLSRKKHGIQIIPSEFHGPRCHNPCDLYVDVRRSVHPSHPRGSIGKDRYANPAMYSGLDRAKSMLLHVHYS